jgi:tetratricopeptide (TPR) repeat protein
MPHPSLLASVALALTVGLATTAHAQADGSQDERARLHFQAGSSHFDTGDYDSAVREFRAAYELSRRPVLLFNIYMAYERLGNLTEAVSYLERYLEEAPEVENRAALEIRLGRLRERAARGETSMPPMDEAPPAPARGPDLMAPAIVSLAAGGAGLLAFAIFGPLALTEDADLANRCGTLAGRVCTDQQVSTLVAYTIVTDVGWVLALVGGGVGTLLLLLDGGGSSSAAAVMPLPWATADGGGVSLGGRF